MAGIIGIGSILGILKYSGVLDNYIDNAALYTLDHTDRCNSKLGNAYS